MYAKGLFSPNIVHKSVSNLQLYCIASKKKKKVFDYVVHSFSMAVQSCWVCPDPKNRKTAHFRMAFNCVQPKKHLCKNHAV